MFSETEIYLSMYTESLCVYNIKYISHFGLWSIKFKSYWHRCYGVQAQNLINLKNRNNNHAYFIELL